MSTALDLLSTLTLRDRYEPLAALLGPEVANLLVAPDQKFIGQIESFARDVLTRDEGVLIPVWGPSGSGKTTLVMNLQNWLPNSFTRTATYNGPIDFDALHQEASVFEKSLPADNKRIIPMNFDHRENHPPSDRELSVIKRFLRQNSLRTPIVIFWPETNMETAKGMAEKYTGIAGTLSIKIPLEFRGPSPDAWQSIAIETLKLCNQIENLEELGVDPRDYRPSEFQSLGYFLRKVSQDFNQRIQSLRDAVQKPLTLIIGFVSETANPGVLSQLTNPSRYSLLNGQALVAVTRESELGKWWADRPGLLTRAIVQLSAHAISIPPATAISCVRNVAEDDHLFKDLGYQRQGPHQAARDLARSDLGKLVKGEPISRFEARGVPAEKATEAFRNLANAGFRLAKDKKLNGCIAVAIKSLLEQNSIQFEKVASEEKLEFCNIIPDNSIYTSDHIICIEYTWRKGDYLVSGNRSAIAQYVLRKIQTYVRQLGWTSD